MPIVYISPFIQVAELHVLFPATYVQSYLELYVNIKDENNRFFYYAAMEIDF